MRECTPQMSVCWLLKIRWDHHLNSRLLCLKDSTDVSIFVDILVELTNAVFVNSNNLSTSVPSNIYRPATCPNPGATNTINLAHTWTPICAELATWVKIIDISERGTGCPQKVPDRNYWGCVTFFKTFNLHTAVEAILTEFEGIWPSPKPSTFTQQ